MEPMFDFSIEEGEQLTIECTIQNPESLANIENGSLALTKGGSNLTRKLGIFELTSFYTKVFLFKRNLFSSYQHNIHSLFFSFFKHTTVCHMAEGNFSSR